MYFKISFPMQLFLLQKDYFYVLTAGTKNGFLFRGLTCYNFNHVLGQPEYRTKKRSENLVSQVVDCVISEF